MSRGTALNITLRQMEYVVAVAEFGHFGRAAESCHVSQPALSRQIKRVEELFDSSLFERTPRGAIPTDAGRRFVADAREILNRTRRLVTRLESSNGELRGPLNLGTIPTVGPYLLPGVLGQLHAARPGLELTIVEDQTSRLLESLDAARLDAALLATPIEAPVTDEMALIDDPFVAVFHRDHELARQHEISPEELTEFPVLLLEEGHCFRDHALEFCASSDSIDEADTRATSLSTLLSLVELGRGVTIVPVLALAPELAARDHLVARAFRGRTPSRTLSLLWRSSSPRRQAFNELGQLFADHTKALNDRLTSAGFDGYPTLTSLIEPQSPMDQ